MIAQRENLKKKHFLQVYRSVATVNRNFVSIEYTFISSLVYGTRPLLFGQGESPAGAKIPFITALPRETCPLCGSGRLERRRRHACIVS